MNDVKKDCDCEDCRQACTFKPGWFLPSQVPDLVAYLGKPLDELVGNELAYDWYEGLVDTVVIAPNVVGNEGKELYPANPKGTCVFFEDGRCSIHAVKPFECREYYHSDTRRAVSGRHYETAQAWKGSEHVLHRPVEDIRDDIPAFSFFDL